MKERGRADTGSAMDEDSPTHIAGCSGSNSYIENTPPFVLSTASVRPLTHPIRARWYFQRRVLAMTNDMDFGQCARQSGAEEIAHELRQCGAGVEQEQLARRLLWIWQCSGQARGCRVRLSMTRCATGTQQDTSRSRSGSQNSQRLEAQRTSKPHAGAVVVALPREPAGQNASAEQLGTRSRR